MNTFGIDFIQRLQKANKTKGLIYARITVNGGQPKEVSIKELIPSTSWDSQREEMKGNGIRAKQVNQVIEDVRFKIKKAYRFLEDTQFNFTAQDVKEVYQGEHHTQNQKRTLSTLITYHNEQWKTKLKPGTFKNYKATETYLKNFVQFKFKREDIFLTQIDYQFLTEFETYIPDHPIKKHDKCHANGTAKHIERVQKMVGWAKKLKWLRFNPLEDYAPHREKTFRKKLSLDELIEIEGKKIINERLGFVRDIFLFCCYTGLAYAEYERLADEHFEVDSKGKLWCMIHRQKSSQFAGIPMLPEAIAIINKYKADPRFVERGKIFPYITNQEVNRYLKILQEVCGILKEMSFHLARHTFATTIMLKSGVPIETVSKMLGHARIKTTEIYTEIDQEKIGTDTEDVVYVLQERRKLRMAG